MHIQQCCLEVSPNFCASIPYARICHCLAHQHAVASQKLHVNACGIPIPRPCGCGNGQKAECSARMVGPSGKRQLSGHSALPKQAHKRSAELRMRSRPPDVALDCAAARLLKGVEKGLSETVMLVSQPAGGLSKGKALLLDALGTTINLPAHSIELLPLNPAEAI